MFGGIILWQELWGIRGPTGDLLPVLRSGVVFVANLRVLGVLGGGRTPSMDSSPISKEFCRYGRVRFKKGTRDSCGAEFKSHCNLVVNVSGSTTPSIKL